FDTEPTGRVDAAIGRINDALVNLAAFTGLSVEGMTHDKGWRLLDIGRRIERAYHLLALLRHAMIDTDENEPVRMQALLEVVNNAMTYRSRYRTLLQPAPVLDLLLLDESNPRSLAHQLMIVEKHVARLSNGDVQASRPPEQRVALRALTAVQLAQIDDLVATPTSGHRKPLANLIERTRADLNDLARTIADAYFTHVLPAQQLGGSARAKEVT
ncbi:MAG TPA: alpha-E domain-containing protein, partial [Tepidisphaeraceae bacterium]|nr:alpha-E domain-containing protein [Tepidisphaeraceae bacterium]